MSEKDRRISQTQPCSGDHTYSRPGPSNSCCVLFSPGKCFPRVGGRGHDAEDGGPDAKAEAPGTDYDNQHHPHHHHHRIFICRTPIVCNHGDNLSERGGH